jgi:hypothetical protein
MELHSPQGRHSMDIVRTASSAYIPKWFFRKTTDILPFAFRISNSPKLSQLVHHVVSKDLTKERLSMMPHQRSLTGEWVIDKQVPPTSDAVVLFLHGGYCYQLFCIR